MAAVLEFEGFPRDCLKFLPDLQRHNDKAWFDRNRSRYEASVLEPARLFIEAMGERLVKIAPGIHADPRTNQSLFRINRDTRFSKDKRPYKTHLAVWFWEGDRPRMECSGFYFQLAPPSVMLGCGIYQFPRPLLEAYRHDVVHSRRGPALVRAIKAACKPESYELWGETYKRVPRGFDAEHRRADLLRHSGVCVGFEKKAPAVLHSRKLVDFCFDHFKAMAPLHRWLREL